MSPAAVCLPLGMTAAAYWLSRAIGRRWSSPLTTPLFLSTALVVVVLSITRMSLSQYAPAKSVISPLLGPATVALAVPLYRKRALILSNLLPAIAGLVGGALGTIAIAIGLSRFFGLSRAVTLSVSVKSVTIPVAVELARLLGGDPTLASGLVIVTAMLGAMLGPWMLDRAGISSSFARGLALGTISSGQGAAQAATESETAGATAGMAMGFSAILVALAAPQLLSWM